MLSRFSPSAESRLLNLMLEDINKQRAAVGASQVVVPGMSPAPNTTAPKSATPAPGTSTYDPSTRTISGPGADTAGATSTANRNGTYTAPTSPRAAADAVARQNSEHVQALNKPSEVTTFNDVAANLMSDYSTDKLNTYFTQGKVTQDQVDQIMKSGGLTPDLALKLGLGKTQTVNGQLGLQQLSRTNLETRLKTAKADLDAGYIDEATYNNIKNSVTEGIADADRIIGSLQNPYLASTASGQQQGRLAQINQQLDELNQPVNFDGLYSYLDHTQAAKMMADREAAKSALAREKATILEKQKTGNTQSYGPDASGKVTAESRVAAVQGLLKQGITDPNQILDYLNYSQDGQQVGDFTLDEVKSMMKAGGQGGGMQVTPVTTSMIEGLIGKVTPEQGKFLQGALTMLQQRMGESVDQFSDDKAQADYEMSQFNSIASDMLKRADSVQAIASSLAKKQQADDEAAAAATKEAELRKNETERQLTSIKLNEQRRQLEISNSKKINSMSNRLAIAGGFGSMGGIKQIEEAQAQGDQAVARFVNDIALTDQHYLDRAVQIDSNYTGAISQIHRTYGDQILQVVSKYNDRVDEVQKLLFGSAQKRNEAVQIAKNRMRDQWDKLHEKTIGYLSDAVKDAAKAADELRKEQYTRSKDSWSQAMQYMQLKGTSDTAELGRFEGLLGLPSGTLSKYKTLAEVKALRTSANGTPAGAEQTKQYVETLRAQIIRGNPGFTGEQVDSAVLEATQNTYSGAKNEAFRRATQNYVNDNNYDPYAGQFRWVGDGAVSDGSKPYFVNYKFRPTFEQTVYTIDGDTQAGLNSL